MVGRKARTGHERARVLDAHGGKGLASIVLPGTARWVGSGHRFAHPPDDGRIVVHELERGRALDLGSGDNREHVIDFANGDLLVVTDTAVRVHGGDSGVLLRTLRAGCDFPACASADDAHSIDAR